MNTVYVSEMEKIIKLFSLRGISYEEKDGHIRLTGADEELTGRYEKYIRQRPELEAELLKLTGGSISLKGYLTLLRSADVSYEVRDNRIFLHGGKREARERCREILSGNVELEVQMIMMLAVHDATLLDTIKERASIRWVEGYSDTLHDAVLCNIRTVPEEVDRRELKERFVADWEHELEAIIRVIAEV